MMIIRLLNFGILALLVLLIVFGIVWVIRRSQQAEPRKKRAKIGELPADAGVRDLIAEGRMREAVELYQRFTGMDEFSARDAVEAMRREMRLSQVPDEVRELVDEGEKARAIETYQALTGADLEEALHAVESLQQRR
jgi:hypothetical protein